jgi:hypothetical protein
LAAFTFLAAEIVLSVAASPRYLLSCLFGLDLAALLALALELPLLVAPLLGSARAGRSTRSGPVDALTIAVVAKAATWLCFAGLARFGGPSPRRRSAHGRGGCRLNGHAGGPDGAPSGQRRSASRMGRDLALALSHRAVALVVVALVLALVLTPARSTTEPLQLALSCMERLDPTDLLEFAADGAAWGRLGAATSPGDFGKAIGLGGLLFLQVNGQVVVEAPVDLTDHAGRSVDRVLVVDGLGSPNGCIRSAPGFSSLAETGPDHSRFLFWKKKIQTYATWSRLLFFVLKKGCVPC